jgi:hypothetical protein
MELYEPLLKTKEMVTVFLEAMNAGGGEGGFTGTNCNFTVLSCLSYYLEGECDRMEADMLKTILSNEAYKRFEKEPMEEFNQKYFVPTEEMTKVTFLACCSI